jgi:hypothetical protein
VKAADPQQKQPPKSDQLPRPSEARSAAPGSSARPASSSASFVLAQSAAWAIPIALTSPRQRRCS